MSLNRRGLWLLALGLVPMHGVLAQEASGEGWYLGGLFSGSRMELQLGNDPVRNENVGGFALTAGYNTSSAFGFDFEFFASADFRDARPELVAARYSSFTISPRLAYSLNERFDLFARFSLVSAVYEEEYNSAIPLVRGFERSWSGGGAGMGFGVGYAPTQHLSLNLSVDFNAVTLKSDNLDLFTYIPDTEIRERRSGLAIIYRF